MYYNSRERLALRIRNIRENVRETLSGVPFGASQVKEKLLDLARRPGEYLFFGYNVGDRVSVILSGKEVWYKVESRYTDTDTKELTYSAILVSDRREFYAIPIPTKISIHHKDVRRKD